MLHSGCVAYCLRPEDVGLVWCFAGLICMLREIVGVVFAFGILLVWCCVVLIVVIDVSLLRFGVLGSLVVVFRGYFACAGVVWDFRCWSLLP